MFREIVEVLASQKKKGNHLRPTSCPKGLSIRSENSILMLLDIATGAIGITAGRQIEV
jgi:hypothetical protein